MNILAALPRGRIAGLKGIQSSLGVYGGLFPGPPCIPKSEDAQVLYLNGLVQSAVHICRFCIQGYKRSIVFLLALV